MVRNLHVLYVHTTGIWHEDAHVSGANVCVEEDHDPLFSPWYRVRT